MVRRLKRPDPGVLAFGVSVCHAESLILYDVNLTIGAAGSLTGFIVTDGNLGTLSQSDIVDWALAASDGTDAPFLLTGPLSGDNSPSSWLNGSDLSATASQLLFNFSGTDGGGLNFENSAGYACFESNNTGCYPNTEMVLDMTPPYNRVFTYSSGTQVIAENQSSVPEPSTAALFLCAGIAAASILRRQRGERRA